MLQNSFSNTLLRTSKRILSSDKNIKKQLIIDLYENEKKYILEESSEDRKVKIKLTEHDINRLFEIIKEDNKKALNFDLQGASSESIENYIERDK